MDVEYIKKLAFFAEQRGYKNIKVTDNNGYTISFDMTGNAESNLPHVSNTSNVPPPPPGPPPVTNQYEPPQNQFTPKPPVEQFNNHLEYEKALEQKTKQDSLYAENQHLKSQLNNVRHATQY